MRKAFTLLAGKAPTNEEVAQALTTLAAALLAPREAPTPDEHVQIEATMAITGHRTSRALRDAIRRKEIQAFGNQRSRTVRRGDLLAWMESRTTGATHDEIDDDDIARRMKRLEGDKKAS